MISDIANIIIAIVNLIFAVYIFVYQKRQSDNEESKNKLLEEKNTKLQWFKDLIINPNISLINLFYQNIITIDSKLKDGIATEEISQFVKDEARKIRINFIDLLNIIDDKMANDVQENVDQVVDTITTNLFDNNIDLSIPDIYFDKIEKPIQYSKNELIGKIYNYKGVNKL